MAYHISIIPLYTVLYSISIMTRNRKKQNQPSHTRTRTHFVILLLLFSVLVAYSRSAWLLVRHTPLPCSFASQDTHATHH